MYFINIYVLICKLDLCATNNWIKVQFWRSIGIFLWSLIHFWPRRFSLNFKYLLILSIFIFCFVDWTYSGIERKPRLCQTLSKIPEKYEISLHNYNLDRSIFTYFGYFGDRKQITKYTYSKQKLNLLYAWLSHNKQYTSILTWKSFYKSNCWLFRYSTSRIPYQF